MNEFGENLAADEALAKLALTLRMFYAYILKSKSHSTYFYGSTEDVKNRLKQHNAGKVRYTKGRRPWKIHYTEDLKNDRKQCSESVF